VVLVIDGNLFVSSIGVQVLGTLFIHSVIN
jgi:hypothetical protein